MLKEIIVENIPLLQSTQISAKHFFTGKPLNMRREVGEKARSRMAGILLPNCTHITFPRQTHSDNIVIIDHGNKNNTFTNTDALITAIKGVPIGVVTADCVPIIVFDELNQVAAAIHSGWRGTQKEIVRKTIETMTRNFATKPDKLKVAIGPSISPSVYEVGAEVKEQFLQTDPNYATCFAPFKNQKYLLNLWNANHYQLTKSGIAPENIDIAKMCTFTQNNRFYSARREGADTGRNAAIIIL